MQITKCSELKECLGVVFPHRVIVNKSLRLLSISGTYTSIPEHSIVEVVILTVIDVDIPSTDIIAFEYDNMYYPFSSFGCKSAFSIFDSSLDYCII